jgi:DNA-binding MarR family transcriptional regulator
MEEDDVARLRSVINKLSRQFNASAVDEGLTPSQASALGLIVKDGPLSLSELTEREGLNPSMVSRIVGHLDAAGLVKRTPNPEDLRAGKVEVTPEGRTVQARIMAARGRVASAYLDRLSGHDRDAIVAVLPALEALAREFRFEA